MADSFRPVLLRKLAGRPRGVAEAPAQPRETLGNGAMATAFVDQKSGREYLHIVRDPDLEMWFECLPSQTNQSDVQSKGIAKESR